MLSNYLKITLRNLWRQKGYTTLNLVGLACGMAACLLLFLYVQDELSYDQEGSYADRLYRVHLVGSLNGEDFNSATTSAPMAAALVDEVPPVEAAARFWPAGRVLFSHGDTRYYEDDFAWADPDLPTLFDYTFLQGDPATALVDPNTIVLTASTAQRYFSDADPMGEVLRFDNREDYTVTGIVADPTRSSHLRFDLLGSLSSTERSQSPIWVSNNFYTYVLARAGATGAEIDRHFAPLIEKYVVPQIEQVTGQSYADLTANGLRYSFYTQAVPELHLRSQADNDFAPRGDIAYVYVLGAIALFILLLAAVNFTNLTTARSAGRAREVGLRKVMGSARMQLVHQFLGESTLLSLLAMILAIGLVSVALPWFNDLTGKTLASALLLQPMTVVLILGVVMATGLLAGLYPAFVLSAFQPATVLKGALSKGARGSRFRSTLVVFQFAVTIVLLVATAIVFRQLSFMQTTRLGFNDEQVVVLPIESDTGRQQFDAFRQTLLQHPGIVAVGGGDDVPGRFFSDTVFLPEGGTESDYLSINIESIDAHYLEALQIEMAAGRGYSEAFPADTANGFIVNETAARRLGFASADEAIGKRISCIGCRVDDSDDTRPIVGVTEDFHFASLRSEVRPLVLVLNPNDRFQAIIRIAPTGIPETLAFIEAQKRAFEPNFPYRYTFLDEDFSRLYAQERQLGELFAYFTGFAVLIACLGLFGLAAYLAEQRTKEIGVRKVMGASVGQIVVLLSRDFTRLVGIAFVVAAPVAYLLMDRWLQDFAYRVGMPFWLFLAMGALALGIAFLTVSYQALKVATTDPVHALRYE